MSVEITIEGLDRMLELLDPKRAIQEIDKAVDRAASMLRDEVKRMPPVSASRTGYSAKGIPVAPKHGGTLRQQIRSRKLGVMMAEVFGGAHYTGYVHDGTSKMPARPFFRWQLEDFGGKDKVEIIITAALERIANP